MSRDPRNQPRTVIQSMTRTPNDPAQLPNNTAATANVNGVQVTTGTNLQSQENIGDLITHLAKSDPHLWQALQSLQRQANGLVNNIGNWTSWTPEFKDASGQVPTVTHIGAYYMTIGPLLFIEVQADISTISIRTYMSMPVDVGSVVTKTCAAYLIQNTTVPVYTGVIGVEIVNTTALITQTPPTVGTPCTLVMGGAIGII